MDKALNYMALARKAGRIELGEEPVGAAARAQHARLVIVASDASDNTKKKFRNSCEFYSVSLIEYSHKAELGRYTGREFAVVLAVTNQGIADELQKCLGDN